MEKIGRVILKGIYNNLWIKVEYKNKNEEITKYMIGINEIFPSKKMLKCDIFNIVYNSNTEEGMIYFDNILSASICEYTYHKTPNKLLEKVINYNEEYTFLKVLDDKEDILDYYSECYKLDTTPYISKYGMIKGIDDEVLRENETYKLSEDQFQILARNAFFQEEKKKIKQDRYDNNLACNVLSIKTKKGIYVLAHRMLLLDIDKKSLVVDNKVVVNKEFNLDPESKDVNKIESIYKYIPEDDHYLLEDFLGNLSLITKSIHEYNDTRNSAYIREVKTDSEPFIFCLGREHSVDLDKELLGIRRMINNVDEMSNPIKTFFGEDVKMYKRNYPIFTVDKRFDIDQINAINQGLKSPVSYIQGPPGTGKTQTLLNAIISAQFNGKTVLVTSNNNIPMDGVYDDILKLKYKDNIPLLFPVIRLGSFSNCEKAIDRINEMFEIASKMKPNESQISKIKQERQNDMKNLVELLINYEKYVDLKNRENGLLNLRDKNTSFRVSVNIEANLTKVREELKEIGTVDINEFRKYIKVDDEYFRYFFMAIHFETASRLQKLSKPKYKELLTIIKMKAETQEEKDERTKKFRSFLSVEGNLQLFLEIFPVVVATNLSCTYLGDPKPQFDIVMMDEAGQCNVANALIPIIRGNQLMLVGDPQQLKPVIVLDSVVNKALRNKHHIAEEYDYIDNSIYSLFTKIDDKNNETLLSHHYRCHEKIISFSNKKYYHGRLKMRGNSDEKTPLIFVDTSQGDKNNKDSQKNVSELEARFISKFIKENNNLNIGVITPFVRQKECIDYYLQEDGFDNVSVGTIHAFQGDQKDVIILSSAITNSTHQSTFDWLKNNRELINVAVSRAKTKLLVLGNMEAINNLSTDKNDFYELVDYVKKAGEVEVTDVSMPSFALGTRQMTTESERELSETVKQVLSVIDEKCFIGEQVAVSKIFVNEKIDSSLFYKQTFDLVVFRKTFSREEPVVAIELNGPEHYSDEEVMARDRKKKELCDSRRLKFVSLPRDCARDYYDIKKTLKEIIK